MDRGTLVRLQQAVPLKRESPLSAYYEELPHAACVIVYDDGDSAYFFSPPEPPTTRWAVEFYDCTSIWAVPGAFEDLNFTATISV